MSQLLWFEKYRPKTVDDMIIPEAKKEGLRNWFKTLAEGTTSQCAVLFEGDPGLGKTSMAYAILKEFGYKPREFNASDVRSQALINENLDGLINTNNVMKITDPGVLPVGIIMDEVDGLESVRGGMDELLSFIAIPTKRKTKAKKETEAAGGSAAGVNLNRRVPIICICNLTNIKKETIKKLEKECYVVQFMLPSAADMHVVMMKVCTAEGLTLTPEAQVSIIEYAQGDFRRLVSLLEFLYYVHGDTIDTPQLTQAYNAVCRKEQDLHITDSIQKLINEMLPGQVIHNIYDGDKSKTPMVVHQNYLRAIAAQQTTLENRLKVANMCMDSLVTSDIIEKHMYNNQSWYLQSIQGFTSAQIPNYYINLYPKHETICATWASVLAINSQSQNLRKNMFETLYAVEQKHTYTITDVQYLIETLYNALFAGNYKDAMSLITIYKLCEEDLEKQNVLAALDKLAKFIKLSPSYERWDRFMAQNKNNKDLELQLRTIYDDVYTGVRVTTRKIKMAIAAADKPSTKATTPTVSVTAAAATAAKQKPVSFMPTIPSTPKKQVTVAKPKSREEQVTVAKPKSREEQITMAKPKSREEQITMAKPKSHEEQVELVKTRKIITIKKKEPVFTDVAAVSVAANVAAVDTEPIVQKPMISTLAALAPIAASSIVPTKPKLTIKLTVPKQAAADSLQKPVLNKIRPIIRQLQPLSG